MSRRKKAETITSEPYVPIETRKRTKIDITPHEQLCLLGYQTLLVSCAEPPGYRSIEIGEATNEQAHAAMDAIREKGVRPAGLRI